MATKNDVTGDPIRSRVATKAYSDGWNKIFGKAKKAKKTPTKNIKGKSC